MVLSALLKTAKNYTDVATVHGVSYLLSSKLPFIDKLLWLCLITLGAGLSFYLSVSLYGDWQEDLIITSLSDTVKPVTSVPFPSVTICTEGLNMDTVNDVLAKDFIQWIKKKSKSLSLEDEMIKEEIGRFLDEKYGLDSSSGVRIEDVVSALSFPNVDKGVSNIAIQGKAKCKAMSKITQVKRKKRFTCPDDLTQVQPILSYLCNS